jgi:hypothetical protein
MSRQDRVACVIKKLADQNNDTGTGSHDFPSPMPRAPGYRQAKR